MVRNILQKVKVFFKQGLNPKELAMSITFAIMIGIFPIYGITTAILTILALRLKLNLPLMLAVSYILTPVQIFGIVVFLRTGEFFLGLEPLGLDLQSIKEILSAGFIRTLQVLSGSFMTAIFGWVLIALPFSLFLYIFLFQIFKKFKIWRLRKESEQN
ncbi:DUF2062 domain-containing protein [Shivajiella indica]|uniref:DUF2062 domain-containing protein n=1 Tax=Shivajiella indica TaxID=872115 RepID=A0ABW5BB09_9BACT